MALQGDWIIDLGLSSPTIEFLFLGLDTSAAATVTVGRVSVTVLTATSTFRVLANSAKDSVSAIGHEPRVGG